MTVFALEGGGIACIAHLGVLMALHDFDELKRINIMIGSSGGGIIAGLWALGLKAKEIMDAVVNLDFNDFLDKGNPFSFSWRLLTKASLYKGKALGRWFENIVRERVGPNATLLDVFNKTGRVLHLTATLMYEERTIILNHNTFPDMPITTAIRATSAHPGAFEPVVYYDSGRKLTLIDGGMLKNYPIDILEIDDIFGSKLISGDEVIVNGRITDRDEREYRTSAGVVFQLIKIYMRMAENIHMRDDYWKRTIKVHIGSVRAFDVNITPEKRRILIKSGYDSAVEFLEQNQDTSS